MDFLKTKISVSWAIIFSVITFLLGPGVVWEWRKTDIDSARLNNETAVVSYDLRQKMNPMLLALLKFDTSSPDWHKRLDDFNMMEKNLARIEGRKPVVYILAPPSNLTVD